MLDESAFLNAIAEDEDDAARLAFADWLEERGDPRAAWVRDPDVFRWMGPRAEDPRPALLAALEEQRFHKQAEAAEVLSRVADASTVPALLALVERGWHAYDAATVLSKMGTMVVPIAPRLVELIVTQPDSSQAPAVALSAVPAFAPQVVPALIERLARDEDWESSDRETENALTALGPAAADAAPALVTRLSRNESHASYALEAIGPAATVAILAHANCNGEWLGRAADVLGRYGEAIVPQLRAALADENEYVRLLAALALAAHDGPAAVPVLVEAVGRSGEFDSDLRSRILHALTEVGPAARSAIPALRGAVALGCFEFPDGIRLIATHDLATAEALVLPALSSSPWGHRLVGARSLRAVPTPMVVAAALPLLLDPVQHVRMTVVDQLRGLDFTGMDRPALVAAVRAAHSAEMLRRLTTEASVSGFPFLAGVIREAMERDS